MSRAMIRALYWLTLCATLGCVSIVTVAVLVAPRSGHVQNLQALRQNLDLPYDSGALGDDDEEAAGTVQFYGSNYEGNAVVFCLDDSLSMRNHGRWEIQQ